MAEAPKVFISYSHDGEEHEARVLELCNRLRTDGIDADIDQYEDAPDEGWPAWCEGRIAWADRVLMVCSETYCRRVAGREEADRGLGVVWEARLIRQLIYEAASATDKFIPVLFTDGSPAHIPTAVKGATRWVVDTPQGYEGLYRQLTSQPRVRKPGLGRIATMPPRDPQPPVAAPPLPVAPPALPPRRGPAHPPPVAEMLHPRVDNVFVGRERQLAMLTECLLPESGTERRPVAVMGMGGVGKSYLIDRFFWQNRDHFPGGYQQLVMDTENPLPGDALLEMLADRMKLPATADSGAIADALRAPLALVHVENVDTPAAAQAVGDLALCLADCALVVSARLGTLATGTDWGAITLGSFDEATALEQFRRELGAEAPADATLLPLVQALGGLPLAVHLAAGYLLSGETADGFLRLLRRRGLSLEPINLADPTFRERSRGRLGAVFTLSLAALERSAEARGCSATAWRTAFQALNYAPAAGFGDSLGAAIAGLDIEEFTDLARAACTLSMLERVRRSNGSPAFRLHPLLAETGRTAGGGEDVLSRITGWFCERLPGRRGDQGQRWSEIHGEIGALVEWLGQVAAADRVRVGQAGGRFAITNGPYYAWLRFCEETLRGALSEDERSEVLWTLGNVAWRAGLAERALKAADGKRVLDRQRGDDRGVAVACGLVADILFARGELDEVLRIRREEELPVYERLGDRHSWAVTQGQIADILLERGELDEALQLYRGEVLPAFEQLADPREHAVVLGKIAEIHFNRGELDAALRIRREEQLPVYESLGDIRLRTLTLGQIADILSARGELDEALRLHEQEELPVYERLGDVLALAVTYSKIAALLAARGRKDEALRLLREEALPRGRQLGASRAIVTFQRQIDDILAAGS